VALLVAAAPACADWHAARREKMGTSVEIELWHDDAPEALRLIESGMAEFDRIEAAMSTYRESSEISVVNRQAAQAPVAVSSELFELVQRSQALSRQTGGAFDITFDSVGYLYDYRQRRRPDAAGIEARLPALDYRHVLLDEKQRTISFTTLGTRINLGGIAKGYACERVAGVLRAAGVRHALVNAGGDTRLLGDRRGQPWVAGIRDPDDGQRWVTRLTLADEALSTSGDYERYFEEDGARYHHIINPQTGRSATGVRSATVVGPDATLTDGLSTSVFVLGVERGLELIDSLPDYEAVIIDDARNVRFSRGFEAR
jgi:thiamine biosynthesis lipoprotein